MNVDISAFTLKVLKLGELVLSFSAAVVLFVAYDMESAQLLEVAIITVVITVLLVSIRKKQDRRSRSLQRRLNQHTG